MRCFWKWLKRKAKLVTVIPAAWMQRRGGSLNVGMLSGAQPKPARVILANSPAVLRLVAAHWLTSSADVVPCM